jgi:hypothetical protein
MAYLHYVPLAVVLFLWLGGIMGKFGRLCLAGVLVLALAGAAWATTGQADAWNYRSDGWYAPSKAAAEIKDYGLVFSKELAADKEKGWQSGDDTIASATWAYAGGITGGPESLIADPKISGSSSTGVGTWLAGGTAGQKYAITITLTTSKGRKLIFPFKIEVK